MALPTSHLAYQDCYEVMDRALADSHGARVRCASHDAAINLRMRFHQARAVDRRRNEETYERGHPMYGVSVYDALICRIRVDAEWAWLYLEKREMLMGEVETLGEAAPLIEHQSVKLIEGPKVPEPEPELKISPKVARRI